MADGCRLDNLKFAISPPWFVQRCDEISHTFSHTDPSAVKILKFYQSEMVCMAATL